MPNTHDTRNRCRREAIRLGFSLRIFNRIPIHYFDYFRSPDPLSSVNVPVIAHLELITIFMLINQIDVGLMLAFYNAGDVSIDVLMQLARYLHHMWTLYGLTSPNDRLSTFGDHYAYHLESRSTRRIDMTQPNVQPRRGNRFVPNNPRWPRNRAVRAQIRGGMYIVRDDHDLSVVHDALCDGLFLTGRYHPSH